MDLFTNATSTIIALAATVISICSFVVSVQEVRATRRHNRHSVRPALQLWLYTNQIDPKGIKLVNCGLGPAIMTKITFSIDDQVPESWKESVVTAMRKRLPYQTTAITFHVPPHKHVIPVGYNAYLFRLVEESESIHQSFEELIMKRMTLEIHYESFYGGENFVAKLENG
jgi:hypothetical protein